MAKTKKTARKKSSKKKVKSVPVVEVKPEPVPEVVVVQAAAPEVDVVEDTLQLISDKITSLSNELKNLKTIFKTLGSQVRKQKKELKKNKRRRRNTSGVKRKPSGFAKPAEISSKLCDFLGKPHGTSIARTEVTKFLTGYIKEHSLQNPKNRKQILPDKKLKSIFGPLQAQDKQSGYTYFNLQRYLRSHFPKSKAALAAAAAH